MFTILFQTIPPDVKKRKNSNKSKKLNKKRNTLEENNELNEVGQHTCTSCITHFDTRLNFIIRV